MKLKRIIAFFVDMIIVYFLANFIFMLFFKNDYEKFIKSSDEYIVVLKETINQTKKGDNEKEILEKTNKLNYNYLKSSSTETIIVLSVEILYFIFGQYFNKGQTIGKKLMKIKIKQIDSDKLNAGLFVLRESILFVIPIQIINIIGLMTTGMNTYLKINSITSNLQTLTMAAIVAFILFRSDGKGLHELASKTEVVLINQKEEN